MTKTATTTEPQDIRPLTSFEIEFVTGGVRDGGCILQPTTKGGIKLL